MGKVLLIIVRLDGIYVHHIIIIVVHMPAWYIIDHMQRPDVDQLIGASMSEPHIDELNDKNSVCMYVCTYVCMYLRTVCTKLK